MPSQPAQLYHNKAEARPQDNANGVTAKQHVVQAKPLYANRQRGHAAPQNQMLNAIFNTMNGVVQWFWVKSWWDGMAKGTINY